MNSNVALAPGATVPLTAAGRSAASQSSPAYALSRSRGIVVPSFVVADHVTSPAFVTTIFTGTASEQCTVTLAGGAVTTFAPYAGVPPYAASTDFAYVTRWLLAHAPQISYLSMNAST